MRRKTTLLFALLLAGCATLGSSEAQGNSALCIKTQQVPIFVYEGSARIGTVMRSGGCVTIPRWVTNSSQLRSLCVMTTAPRRCTYLPSVDLGQHKLWHLTLGPWQRTWGQDVLSLQPVG